MRLEQVHYLLEIEKTHSISAAALNLYVSPSSISEAIKKLEQELGYTLFIRSKNGMELTEIGKQVAQECREIEQHIQRIQQMTATNDRKENTLSGSITLSICVGMGHNILLQTFSTFQKNYPNITLKIVEKSISAILDDLLHENCDIALFYCDDLPLLSKIEDKFINEKLITENFYAIVHKEHTLSNSHMVSFKKLSKYPIATYSFGDMMEKDSFVDDFFSSLKTNFNIVFHSNDIVLFKNHLLNSNSVGITLSSIKDLLLQDEQLVSRRISDKASVSLRYFYAIDSPKQVLIKNFIDVLKQNITTHS